MNYCFDGKLKAGTILGNRILRDLLLFATVEKQPIISAVQNEGGEMIWKSAVALGTFVMLVLATHSAEAKSCTELAKACMKYQPRSICFGYAYQQCKKTGVFVGPGTGRSFPATSRK